MSQRYARIPAARGRNDQRVRAWLGDLEAADSFDGYGSSSGYSSSDGFGRFHGSDSSYRGDSSCRYGSSYANSSSHGPGSSYGPSSNRYSSGGTYLAHEHTYDPNHPPGAYGPEPPRTNQRSMYGSGPARPRNGMFNRPQFSGYFRRSVQGLTGTLRNWGTNVDNFLYGSASGYDNGYGTRWLYRDLRF